MAATLFATGKITVAAAGTPVAVSAYIPSTVSGPLGAQGNKTVHAWLIQALSTNVGKVYIGLSTLNKSTLAGVIVTLPVPTTNLLPSFSCSLTEGANALPLDDLYIDADNANDGVTISGVVA